MKAWQDLSAAGRIQRLRSLAMAALDQYAVEPIRLRLVGGFTNVIFRVDTMSGPLALRVDHHQDHSDNDVEIELSWLEALERDTDLGVCRFIKARNGASYVYADAVGIPGARRCVLFRWVPGSPLDDNLTEAGYHELGELSAGLHLHGSGFKPPHTPMAWDRVFYWPEEVDPVVIFKPEMARHLGNGRRATLDSCISALEDALGRLDPAEAQVIHGDLHPSNVHSFRDRLTAFDFEDVTWGHRVQDIAITLFYHRQHAAYSDLRAAFKEGYRTTAPWPVRYEGELEHFMAGRTVVFINYMATLRSDPAEYYNIAFPRLEQFLRDWVT